MSAAHKVHDRVKRRLLERLNLSSSHGQTSPACAAAIDGLGFHRAIRPETIAMQYFTTRYAPNTIYAYVIEFWPTLATNEPTTLAMSSLALTAMARDASRPELTTTAQSLYSKALALVNNALGDSRAAVLDSTLLSVLFLSSYEALVFTGRASPSNWTAHIQGSSTLLHLRGSKQLESKFGRKLFHHASSSIRTSCAQRGVPVPAKLSRLQQQAAPVLDSTSLYFRLGKMLDHFAAFKAKRASMQAPEVIQEGTALDREAAALLCQAETLFPCKTVNMTKSPWNMCTYKCAMHGYTSQSALRYWSSFRILRLTVNQWIFRACRQHMESLASTDISTEYDWQTLLEKTIINAEDMIGDLLTSAPYSAEFLDQSGNCPSRLFIWPLVAAGTSDLCPASGRMFAISRLKVIGSCQGVEQATQAAKMMEDGDLQEDWSVLPLKFVQLYANAHRNIGFIFLILLNLLKNWSFI